MNHRLAILLSNKLLQLNIISEELLELYVYGFELLVSFIVSTSIILIIGSVTSKILSAITFLVVFIFVRRFTGGYHAETYFRCQISMICTFLIIVLFSIHLPTNAVVSAPIVLAVGITTIGLIGPIENKNKPLSDKEKKKHRTTGIIVFAIFAFSAIPLSWLNALVANTLIYTLMSIIILMYIPYIHNRINSSKGKGTE